MVDLRIAENIEQAEARNAIACAVSHARLRGGKADVRPFSGGFLVSGAPGNAAAVGAGRRGRLSSAEVDVMEGFFKRRGSSGAVHLCPEISGSLYRQLQELSYDQCGEMTVMACSPLRNHCSRPQPEVRVEPVRSATREMWVRTVSEGFGNEVTGSIIANMPGVYCYLAVDDDGQPYGGAAMIRHSRVAILFGDSTLPNARGRGVHKELIRRRILAAQAMDCDLATAMMIPGSISQRNYEKSGFELAYTRVALASAA
jgi:hypothetical protein